MDPPHALWTNSCNLLTINLINEFIEFYINNSNTIFTHKQIEQIITLYINNRLDNAEYISLSTIGLSVAKSSYHSYIKKVLVDPTELLDLLIDIYVNELINNINYNKKIIKQYIIRDHETINIINQFIQNIKEVEDIKNNLLIALSDVKCRNIQNLLDTFNNIK